MSDRTRELECVIADLKQQARDAEKECDAMRAELDALKVQKDEALNTLCKVFHAGEEFEGPGGMIMAVDLALWNEGCEALEAIVGGEEDNASPCAHPIPPAPSVISVPDEVREKVMEAVAEALGEAYDCTRVWSAWSYDTMGPEDFVLVSNDSSRLAEIADAAIAALAAAPKPEVK